MLRYTSKAVVIGSVPSNRQLMKMPSPLAIATTLLFWGTNLLEGKLLVPQLVGRATGLHPLAVMLALLAGAHLAGLIGALVAVPFLAAVWEIVRVTRADRQ